MIIGIYGQYGAGKDTVAAMIQKLTCKGRKWEDHGKPYKVDDNRFEIISFADKLKEAASVITGYPLHYFLTQEGKATYMPEFEMTCGQFLQKLGDGARETVHKKIWIISRHTTLDNKQDYINSSVRYPNEADAIREKGGIVIRINGDPMGYRSQPNPTRDLNHSSETSMMNYNFDYVIENDSTLEVLEERVKAMLTHFSLTNETSNP